MIILFKRNCQTKQERSSFRHNGLRLGEVAEGLAYSVAAIAPNCGYRLPFIGMINFKTIQK